MRLLVLGGTAWVGGQVAAEALRRGHEVVCLARGESGQVPEGATLVRGDRDAVEGYAGLTGAFDAVVDVARDPQHVRTATEALSSRAGHWVFVSTSSVYADERTPGADESAQLRPALSPDERWTEERYAEGKVAAEQHLLATLGADRVLVARAGLIAGPGDVSGRTGYWPLRFAHPATDDGSVLVPDSPDLVTQQLDVRDLAAWLVEAAERQVSGVVDAVGEQVRLPDYLSLVREVTGHQGPVVARSPEWLAEHEVAPWMGPRSLPLWLPLPDYAGFTARRGDRAPALGLRRRPLAETVADVLAWELRHGPGRPRRAGLTAHEERGLLEA
ncbi:nucleoside-diphosphate-sugar epimerase [Barrientosiimonas humi]|uniref:Nucleoside-diphosphate-sugar epimerase n=1 Tax=Barrientosiimonas humi TaxID=999931 RepID=A0A542XB57_9MICO|nr:NAD-dependent epimerase/dehydratase family protein [Barrientosiimonas humi]TQL33067.1 nucleoside-diphosphate-sugar epimerase [Barrientosiimonas humi]CAG7573057.1 hypothetical protein BH39T_PBIAJDOK_01682 [Barrientosiimonas humi]